MKLFLCNKSTVVILFLLLYFITSIKTGEARPSRIKISSVKSLTYVLSKIEKANGPRARFVTLKLQIYLEDIYISQGTSIILKTNLLSYFIRKLISSNKSMQYISNKILELYQEGNFHE